MQHAKSVGEQVLEAAKARHLSQFPSAWLTEHKRAATAEGYAVLDTAAGNDSNAYPAAFNTMHPAFAAPL
jgi:hypothetical protein